MVGRSALALAGAIGWPAAASGQGGAVRIVMETAKGTITMDIDTVHAPITGKNFLRYVDGHFFDHGAFWRTVRADNQAENQVRIAVVQAMGDTARARDEFAPIPLERTTVTGLHHVDGTVSMARGGPNSARSQFFICIGDQPALDFGGARNADGQGFAAFGRVVSGMSVVRAIWQAPAGGQGLTPPIAILRAHRT
jgi:peptidyl-prolyl cis-trans isomerase A (cyclophilin A)